MHPDHLNYAQRALSTFIYSAIQRVAHSGVLEYRFSVNETDIREELGLNRQVKSTVLADYVAYFQSKGVEAIEQLGAIDLTLNLNNVSLSPKQAAAFNEAMNLYHVEHG